jgi:RHS repeat-associated protein
MDTHEYDAYGNSFTVSGSTPNEMMYRDEQYDSDLGLYYLRARYYNPNTGRFMSRDPYDGDGGWPTHEMSTTLGAPSIRRTLSNGWESTNLMRKVNVTAANGKIFSYDSQNRLISMSNGDTSATMIYDGDGNRVAKTVNGVTTQYLVDDLNPTGYAQVIDELTGGAVSRIYTYGLQRINENQPISGAWTPSFYGYDGGNVRQLTSAAGTVTDSYEYDAFGNSFTVSGTTPNEMLYRGEQYDPDLGLYYLRARYYNPLTGRFMSRDPEDGNLTDPKSLHKYLYADGDPVNGFDPTGRVDILQYGERLKLFVGAVVVVTSATGFTTCMAQWYGLISLPIAEPTAPSSWVGFPTPTWIMNCILSLPRAVINIVGTNYPMGN